MSAAMLTTEDNPYDPFNQFMEWYNYDEGHGYHTCAYLARVTRSSSALSDLDDEEAQNSAIDEIISFNLTGNYKKVYESSE